MKRYVLVGVTGSRNRGVNALVSAIVQQLSELNQGKVFEICVVTKTADYDRIFLSKQVRVIQDPYSGPLGVIRYLLARLLIRVRVGNAHKEYLELCTEKTVLIVTGGDVFSSDYGGFRRYIQLIKDFRRHGAEVHLAGHSIGRFNKRDFNLWYEVEALSSSIATREKASLEYISAHSKDISKYREAADVAFLLTPSDDSFFTTFSRNFNLPEGKILVALSCSQGVTSFADIDGEAHFEALSELIRCLVAEDDVFVLLIPHVQETSTKNDDSILTHRLYRKFEHSGKVMPVNGHFDAANYKAIIARCQFVIAERMHAAVAGYSSLVPTVTIGYSIKYEGLARQVYPTLPQQQVLVDVRSFVVDSEAAVARIVDAFHNRQDLQRDLEQSVPQVKELAIRCLDGIAPAE